MKNCWLRTAALALVGLLVLATPSAQAQMVTRSATVTTTTAGTMEFTGTVAAIGPDVVALDCNGTLLHIPMRLARFEVNGVDMDPNELYPGMPVTVDIGSLRGTITAMTPTSLTLATPNGVVELPSQALYSDALAYCDVSFRNMEGQVASVPLGTALDLGTRHLGTLAIGSPATTTTVVARGTSLTTTTTTTVVTTRVPALTLQGTVEEVGPNTLLIETASGVPVMVPGTLHATYMVNGQPITFNSLHSGSAVMVTIPTFSGQLTQVNQ